MDGYGDGIPRGADGDQAARVRHATSVLMTGNDEQDPGRDETNELLGYLGWNYLDATPAPADDGPHPSPRPNPARDLPEAAAVGAVQAWQRYPELLRVIVERAGADGVRALGTGARQQIGAKLGAARTWRLATAFTLGRGISMGLGHCDGQQREDELRATLGVVRRLYTGLRGPDAPLFASMDGYRSATLDAEWLDWLAGAVSSDASGAVGASGDDVAEIGRLDAAAGRVAAALHLGVPGGSQVSGPSPLPDGGALLVRDHFLHDEDYHWADVCEGLPHALTVVTRVVAAPAVSDAGTVLGPAGSGGASAGAEVSAGAGAGAAGSGGGAAGSGAAGAGAAGSGAGARAAGAGSPEVLAAAVFVRDTRNTPTEQIRRLTAFDDLAAALTAVAERLERRIAAMPRRDRVMAGAQVYYLDAIAPLARAAGVWDELRARHDVYELDPLASQVYYDLVPGGGARDLVPRLVRTGAAFAPVKDPMSAEEAFPALHLLALRGHRRELPVPAAELAAAGLIGEDDQGYHLSEAGRTVHERQLAAERATYEPARLEQAYERFAALDEPLHALAARWDAAGSDGERAELVGALTDVLQRARVALRRTNEQLLRFEGYLPRLRRGLARAEAGEPEYVSSPDVESVLTVWHELSLDYRLTQGLPPTP